MRDFCIWFILLVSVAAWAQEEAVALDWASEVTGNPWDMEGKDDIRLVTGGLQVVSVQSGVATLRRGGSVYLSLRGHLLDGNRYNRAKVRARAERPVNVQVTYLSALNPYYPYPRRASSAPQQLGTEWTTVELALPIDRAGAEDHPAAAIVQELGLTFSGQGDVRVELDSVQVLRDATAPSQADSPLPYQDYRHTHDPLPELDMRYVEEPLFSFAVFTDPHFSTNEGPRERKQKELVRQINALAPDLVINIGDTITSSPWSPGYRGAAEMAKRILGELKMPLYYVPGNHDVGNKPSFILNKEEGFGNRGLTDETIKEYEELFNAPSYYSFDHKGCHFAYIDTMGLGSNTSDDQAQTEWLRKDLASSQDKRFRFLFGHVHPMYKDLGEPEEINYDAIDQPHRKELLDLCNEQKVDILMCGHTHHFFFNRYGCTRLFTLPSSAFPRWARWHLSGDPDFKLSYAVVRVYGNRYDVNVVRIPEPLLHPRVVQEGNEFPARQIMTEQSDEHSFPAAGVNADLVTEDLLAWSQSNLNDGLTTYPGRTGGDGVAGVCWSSQPTRSSEEKVTLQVELGQVREVREVRAIGVKGQGIPRITATLMTESGEEAGKKQLVREAGGDVLAAQFDGIAAYRAILTLEELPLESRSNENHAAQLAEVEVIDTDGRNVALKEYGTLVKASSNRTVRSSNVYNSNPIFTDERQWHFLQDLGVNLVRLEPDSLASRMVRRDGKVVLNPPTRALLEEGAKSGIRYIVRLRAHMESPSGASAVEIAQYVSNTLGAPAFEIEVDGSPQDMLELAEAVRDVAAGRKVILGGIRLEEVTALAEFPELIALSKGICVDVDCRAGARETIESAKSTVASLTEEAGAHLQVYINVQGGPTPLDEAAWFLTQWTGEAAVKDVSLLWWHATRGDRPFFAFHRGEEPTLPAYALRLLATIVPADPEEVPQSEILESVPGTEIRCVRTSREGAASMLIAIFPDGSDATPDRFDLKTKLVRPEAAFIDVVAGTVQDAKIVDTPDGAVIPGVIWNGKPILLSIQPGEDRVKQH